MNKSIYVITGSLGFVGFNLSKSLIKRGHRVIGIDIDKNSDSLRKLRYKESVNKTKLVRPDLNIQNTKE